MYCILPDLGVKARVLFVHRGDCSWDFWGACEVMGGEERETDGTAKVNIRSWINCVSRK